MHRFFMPHTISDRFVISDRSQLHYIKDVLRLEANEEVAVFDNSGNEYTCIIMSIGKEQAFLLVKEKKPAIVSAVNLTIACAIPKKNDMDEIVDKLTQLEVRSIIPMETERTIVRLDEDKKESRLNRWRKIAQSAAEQSQRNNITIIREVTDVKDVIMNSRDFNLKLIPALIDDRKHVREIISVYEQGCILVLIGPEGDFTPQEMKLAKDNGFMPVSLGGSVLRVSTAAIAITSYIKLALGI